MSGPLLVSGVNGTVRKRRSILTRMYASFQESRES
jgi:hypothetical protein